MALDTLTAKANTGSGTDSIAGKNLPSGFAGAAILVADDGSSLAKAEDTPATSGDYGVPLLAMRQLADTTSTDTDGDYTLIKIDEEGRVKVATKPASFTLVTGSITANAQTVSCDVSRASNVQFHMVATSLVGHNSTFEGSIDSTNGTDGNWFGIQAVRSNANTIETTTGVLAATPAYAWEASANGLSFVRVRATAHSSGTALWKFQRGSYATEPIPAAQVSASQVVDTELPAAATLADGAANPTTPLAGAPGLLFNGTTWDRYRNNVNTTTGDTGAKTATFNGATQTNYNARGAFITILMGTVTGTTPTFSAQLQWSPDGGTTWLNMGPAMTTITATGNHSLLVYPTNLSQTAGATPANLTTGAAATTILNAPLPRTWRLAYTIGGTTPSFTMTSVQVNYLL